MYRNTFGAGTPKARRTIRGWGSGEEQEWVVCMHSTPNGVSLIYGSWANLQLGCRRGDLCSGWGSFSSAVCKSPEARFQIASEAVRSREGGLSRCETV